MMSRQGFFFFFFNSTIFFIFILFYLHFLVLPKKSFAYILWLLIFMGFLSVWKSGSLYLCSFFLSSFPSALLFFLIQICTFLFYFILFYYYPLEICLFSSEGKKWGRCKREWDWGGVGRVETCSAIIRIHCGGKVHFQ